MSFAVSDDEANVEWSGSSFTALFAQWRNLVRPAFWRMLRDVARFNRHAPRFLAEPENLGFSLRDFLDQGRYSEDFASWYLVPMGAAIWSADPQEFLDFPAAAFIRFFANHGLLGLRDRPQWRTIVGGSASYVDAIVTRLGDRARLATPVRRVVRLDHGVGVWTDDDLEVFDHVVLACHSDDALRLLASPTALERQILSAIRYRSNDAVVHTDVTLMARRARARASWNWRRRPGVDAPTLTYDLSRLQGLDTSRPLYLTLNQSDAVNPDRILATMTFRHPVFDFSAMSAQRRHAEVSGHDRISYAGAYWGYGFHEDGARSAVDVCRSLGVSVGEVVG
jgi:predicted NAD/FAD-binding protein